MNFIEVNPDEMGDILDAMRELEAHDIAEAELCKIVSVISEAHASLGDAVRDWFSEITKTVLGETPYDASIPNADRESPSDGLFDGLLSDPGRAFHAVTDNLALSSSKTGEFKSLLTGSGLTLQERTVVVLHYIHGKSEYESGAMTGYEDTEGILWTALVKIGHVIQHDKRQ